MRRFVYSVLIASVLSLGAVGIIAAYPLASSVAQPDSVTSTSWWPKVISQQIEKTQGKSFQGCLFGDSISSMLGDSLGQAIANFGVGGLSTVSLLEQLKEVQLAQVHCDRVVIAIGTNDAAYAISDADFTQNLQQIVRQVRVFSGPQIILVPAFYSTEPVSHYPAMAGTLERVDEVNQLIKQVGQVEQVPVVDQGLEELYENHSLRSDLTIDGVHFNKAGQVIYRSFLLKLFGLSWEKPN